MKITFDLGTGVLSDELDASDELVEHDGQLILAALLPPDEVEDARIIVRDYQFPTDR